MALMIITQFIDQRLKHMSFPHIQIINGRQTLTARSTRYGVTKYGVELNIVLRPRNAIAAI